MKKWICLLLVCLLLTGCGSAAEETPGPEETQQLVIATPLTEQVYAPLVREFEARTGIWVRVETAPGPELEQRLRAGTLECDLILGCGAEILEANSAYFRKTEAVLPQDIASEDWSPSDTWVPFTDRRVVLIYNPILVRVNPPEGFASLLDPAWKGKIGFSDPRESGAAYTELVTLALALGGDPQEQLRAFGENLDGILLASRGDVVQAVADGTCYVGLTLEEDAEEARKSGLDIAVVYPQEGTCQVPDGIASLATSVHPENADRFLEFALSLDAQRTMERLCSRLPVRTEARSQERELTVLPYDVAWAVAQHDTLLGSWEAIQ